MDQHIPEFFRDAKIGIKLIKLVRGYFYNKLGSLSRKFYRFLSSVTVKTPIGYIVAPCHVPDLLAFCDQLRHEYRIFEEELVRFLVYGELPENLNSRAKIYSEYRDLIEEYLAQHGSHLNVSSISITDRFKIALIPFTLDTTTILPLLDEKARKLAEQYINDTMRTVTESAKRDIEEKVRLLLDQLTRLAIQAPEKTLDASIKKATQIIKIADSLRISTPTLETLRTAISSQNPRKELVKLATSGRLQALLQSMNGG